MALSQLDYTSLWLTGFWCLLLMFVALQYASRRKVHPQEPNIIPSRIPFIGHLLGMTIHGGRYVKRLGLAHPAEPIMTLPVPGSRIYIVTEPSMAAAVQRSSKTLSFTPLVPEITKRVLGIDQETAKIVSKCLDPEPGEPRGYLAEIHDMVYRLLGPGQYLNTLSCDAVQELCLQLHNFEDQGRPSAALNLLLWTRHLVTVSTARYLFGPQNPFDKNTDLEEAFWAFDEGLGGLLLNVVPSVTAAPAYQGREKLVSALKEYYKGGNQDLASRLIRDRVSIEQSHSMSLDMLARSALSFLFAGIVNTTTTTFWTLLRVFEDQDLLAIVRNEIREAYNRSEREAEGKVLSITVVKEECKTLMAVFRECLRVGSENFSIRMVKENTLLADKYFLKKGSVVQISGGVIHASKAIWGNAPEQFDYRRFLSSRTKEDAIHPAAFRSFGGGKTLCPGRYFATNEIVMLTAVIIHCFDIGGPYGGSIQAPPKHDGVLPVHILEPRPDDRPWVKMTAREAAADLKYIQIVD